MVLKIESQIMLQTLLRQRARVHDLAIGGVGGDGHGFADQNPISCCSSVSAVGFQSAARRTLTVPNTPANELNKYQAVTDMLPAAARLP